MTPVYVRSLIELLKFLGWEQQVIAKQLKVSRTAVSLWATGKRPVPRRHEKPFMSLVAEALQQDRAAMDSELIGLPVGADDVPRAEQERRFALVRKWEARVEQIKAYMSAWQIELYVKVGKFAEEVHYELEILKSPYAKIDPLKLDRDERRKLRHACHMLVRHFDYLDQLDLPTPQESMADTRMPEAQLDDIRRWYGVG